MYVFFHELRKHYPALSPTSKLLGFHRIAITITGLRFHTEVGRISRDNLFLYVSLYWRSGIRGEDIKVVAG